MSAATIRHVGPALCLAAFPLLLLTAEALAPWHGAADSEAQTLARAASQAGATNLADLLSFLGILLAVPGFLVVMRLTRGRAPAASLAGGALAIAGYVAGMLQVVSDQYDVLLSPLAGSSSVSDALTSSRAWALPIVLVVFLAGMLLGPVVLGVALWRSHAAPAWTGPGAGRLLRRRPALARRRPQGGRPRGARPARARSPRRRRASAPGGRRQR